MQTTSVKTRLTLPVFATQWTPVLLVILLGCAYLLPAIRLGVGTSPDSVAYLGAARNLVAGKGLTIPFGEQLNTPISQFPPFYSVLLAIPGLVGADPAEAAGVIQVLIFIGNIILVFLTIHQASPGSAWAPLVGILLLVVSPSFLLIHQMSWSEGPFILLVLLAILFVSQYLETGRMGLLLSGAVAVGLATFTRFAGAAFIAALAFGILMLARGGLLKRVGQTMLFSLISSLPLGLWLLQQQLIGAETTNRELGFHPMNMQHIHEIVNTLVSWLLIPATISGTIKIGLLLVGSAAWVLLVHRHITTPGFSFQNSPILSLLAISILAYGLFVLFSLNFMDANIPMDERIFSPILVSLLVLTLGLMGQHIPVHSRVWIGIGALLLVFVLAAGWRNFQWSRTLYSTGGGYNSPQLRSSAIVDAVQSLAKDSVIYSNSPEAVYMQTGRAALRLPRKIELMSQQANPRFSEEMAQLKEDLLAKEGVIVYYAWIKGKAAATKEDLLAVVPLHALAETETGTVYGIRETGE